MDPQLSVADHLSDPQHDQGQYAPSDKIELGSSKLEAGEDCNHENERNDDSNNVSQEVPWVQATSFSRSVSQETDPSSSSNTKKTPIRAVFEDLPTAYLCITAGLAKSRSQDGSSSLLDACPDDMVSSQDTPPEPSLSNQLHEKYDTQSASQFPAQKMRVTSKDHDQTTSPLVNFRKPLTGALHSDTIVKQSVPTTPVASPQQSPYPIITNSAQKAIQRESLNPVVDKGKSVLANQSTALKRKSDHALWVAEESTVGNIYRHYADSSIFAEEFERGSPREDTISEKPAHLSKSSALFLSQSDDQEKPSALDVRKQRRVDRLTSGPQSRPPSCGLPALPTSLFGRLTSGTSQELDRSSSYGDTRNLLETVQRPDLAVPKPTLSRSEGRTDLRLQRPVSEFEDSTDPSITTANSNNPFRRSYCPQAAAPRDSSVDCARSDSQNQGVPSYRQPLERDVSDALRRASGFSIFSNGSASTSLLTDEAFEHDVSNYRRTTFGKRSKMNNTLSEGESSSNNTQNVVAHAQDFYNQRAIPLSWITPNQENAVRVPINRKTTYPHPPTEPHLNPNNTLEHRDDGATEDPEGDPNDWETVGESRFGAEFKDCHGNGGMFDVSTIRRTGSSLANTSNDGTISLYDTDIDDYGSTDRITQHPGTIQYSGDYRQQDLNKTPTPVFPPIYREHKVNGYLAGLTRYHGPSNPFSLAPQPLENLHANPFRSPPPEDLSTPSAGRAVFQKRVHRGRKPNHFPPSTKTVNTAEEDDTTEQCTGSISSSLTPTTLDARDHTYRTLNWNEQLTYPSPSLSHSKRQFLSPINPVGRPDRPSSWRHLMTFGRGEKIEEYNANGTPDETSSTVATTGFADSNRYKPEDAIELRNLSQHRRSASNREHQRLVRGPPGAFYQGIAFSQRDTDSTSSFEARRISSKATPRYIESNDYPTNSLRPLSLLGSGSLGPVEDGGRGRLHTRSSSGRVYRSPHAPPRRLSWQQLYTEAQLQSMQEAATADSLQDGSLVSNTRTSGQGTTVESTYREYANPAFNPQLSSWTQETSARMDLCDRNKKFSAFVLLVCAVFPPLLVMFALGRLDRVIAWWSKGTLTAFEDKYKKLALLIISVWGFVLFVGLIIILVFRYASPTSSSSS